MHIASVRGAIEPLLLQSLSLRAACEAEHAPRHKWTGGAALSWRPLPSECVQPAQTDAARTTAVAPVAVPYPPAGISVTFARATAPVPTTALC